MDHASQITEAILKGSHSLPDKLKLARYAWLTPACHIRQKYQMLVDWSCNQLDSLSKAASDKRGAASADDAHLLWSFLEEALEALVHAQQSASDASGKPYVSPVVVKHRAAQVIMKAMSSAVDAVEGGERAPLSLSSALVCLSTLSSCPQLAPVTMNRTERLVELIVCASQLVSALNTSCSADPLRCQAQQALCSLLHLFLAIQRQQANRKKIFLLAVEKLFGSLLPLYSRDGGVGGDAATAGSARQLSAVIKSVLGATLFDKEHLSQIPSVLAMMSPSGAASDGKAKVPGKQRKAVTQDSVSKSTSHSYKLFTTLQELMKTSLAAGSTRCYQWPPLVFELYLTAARARNDRPAAADMPFFYQMISLLDVPVAATDSSVTTAAAADSSVTTAAAAGGEVQLSLEKCQCILDLLVLMRLQKVYKAVDDRMSGNHHLNWFQQVVLWLVKAPINRLVVCKALSVILEINHRAVELHLQSVLQLAWKSVDVASAAQTPASELLLGILSTYAKLGQLNRLVASLLPAAADIPFQGLPASFRKSFASAVRLLSVGQFSELYESFSAYFAAVLDKLEKASDNVEPRRKRSKMASSASAPVEDVDGMLTGAALYSLVLASVRVPSAAVAAGVRDLLRSTHRALVVPLLEVGRSQLANSPAAPSTEALLCSCLQLAAAAGQAAISLCGFDGDGAQRCVPKPLLAGLVLPVCCSDTAHGRRIVVPTAWRSAVAGLGQPLPSSVLLQLRRLAALWLRAGAMLSDVSDKTTGSGGTANGVKEEAMDDSNDEEEKEVEKEEASVDCSNGQEQILSFVLEFASNSLDAACTRTASERDAASASDSVALDLVVSQFPLVSRLCRPAHWATIGELLLDNLDSLAPDSQAAKSDDEAMPCAVSASERYRRFLRSPSAQECVELHTSLVAASVRRVFDAVKPVLKEYDCCKSVVKVLKSVALECQSLSQLDTATATATSTAAAVSTKATKKWGPLLEGALSSDADAAVVMLLSKVTQSCSEMWKAMDAVVTIAELLTLFHLSPTLLSAMTTVLLAVSYVANLPNLRHAPTQQLSDRCASLLAGVIKRCASPASTSAMDRSRRQALTSCLPPLPALLQYLCSRASDSTTGAAGGLTVAVAPAATAAAADGPLQIAPALQLFASVVTLALAHGPVEPALTDFAESFVGQAASVPRFYVSAAYSTLCGAHEVLKRKSSSPERRELAISVCKILTKKLLPLAVFSSASRSSGDSEGQLSLQLAFVKFLHQAVVVASAADSSKLSKRVAGAVQSLLPDLLRLLSQGAADAGRRESTGGNSRSLQTSLAWLAHAILSHASSLDLNLEPSFLKSCWSVSSHHLSSQADSTVAGMTDSAVTGVTDGLHSSMSGLMLAVPRTSSLDMWKAAMVDFVEPKCITVEWLQVACLVLPADMPAEHRLEFCVAMVKLLPLMPKVVAESSSALSPDDMTRLAEKVLSWATSLAVHGKMCLSPAHIGTMLYICESVPFSADSDRMHVVCSRMGELVHVLLRHHTSSIGSHVPVLFGVCQRLMQATMALSSLLMASSQAQEQQQQQQQQQEQQQPSASSEANTSQASQQGGAADVSVQTLRKCAEAFARVLESISVKKTYSKYAPYILASYLTYSTLYPMHGPVKNALLSGIYALLACCGPHELSLLKATSGRAEQELFDPLYADFKKFFKYSGNI